MKVTSGIFLLMFLSTTVGAQFDATWGYINEKQVDSLTIAVKSELNDTLNMAAFRKLGFNYGETDSEKSIYFHQRQLELAVKLKLQIWEADAYSQIADQHRVLGDIKKAHEYYTKATDIASDEKSERPNWEIGSFSNAQNEHEARITTLGMTYIMYGNLYRGIKLPEKAKQNYNKALELGQSINNGKIISFYYLNTNQYISNDSLLAHLQHSLEWANKSKYYKQKGWIFNAIGGYYLRINQLDSAKAYVLKSIESSQQHDLDPAFIRSNVFASYLYRNENKLDSAIFYAKEALVVASRNPNYALVSVYTNLANTYAQTNKTDSAYVYESLARKLNDSLSTVRLNRMTDYHQVLFNEKLKSTEDENKLKLFLLIAGLAIVLIVASILYRNNRQKQNANKTLESTLSNLKSTQSQLIQSEKMASLGELTAGIAHEIQNPLNFVNNFSEVSNELIDEMNEEIEKGDFDEAKAISKDIKQNLEKINHHGKRADAIVKGMLQHSRKSSAEKEPTDINKLADEYLRLAYHGLRAKDQSFNATLATDFDESIGMVDVIPQDLGRVILNLITNAFYACNAKKKSTDDETFKPTVSVITKRADSPSVPIGIGRGEPGEILITVRDNGNGIPKHVLDKIFQPFFTTKPTGEGTGLGLSMSYDIVTKGHGGELKVESQEGGGTCFNIHLPI